MDVFSLVARLSLNSEDYDKGLDDAKGKADGFGSTLKKGLAVAGVAIGAATTAVTAFAGESVKVGATFDASMSQVAATMGVTVDSIENLREFAQEMGSATAFSASQAADALNYMALAGYDAETSMHMLPNVLNLAAAGGIELAAASDMVTDAQSALGISLDETAELVDKMAKASSKSNTSVAQLGDAILTVGGTAKNLAGGTTELSTALGILADNGIKGAEGGTALRNVILALSAPTDTAAKKMKELGLEAYDAEGNLRPMEDIFLDLNDALSTMTQGEQTEVLNTLFNKVDLKSANALLATSAERWEELSGAIDDASGAAAQMADTQLDNLQGDITLFQSALEGAQIAISEGLMPNLREFVQFGSAGISTLTEAFKEGGLSGAMDALGTVLSDGLAMVMEQLPQFVDAGVQLLSSLGEGIIANLPLMVDAALQIIVSLADGIAENLPELIPTIVDVVLQIVDTLTEPDTLENLVEAALEIMIALSEGLIKALPKLIEKAPEIIKNLVTALVAEVPQILAAAFELIVQLGLGLIAAIPELVGDIPLIIAAIVGGFKKGIDDLKQVGKDMVRGLINGISAMASWASQKVTSFFSGIVNSAKNLLGIHSPSKVFAGIGENMALGLGEGWDDEFSSIKRDINSSLDFGTRTVDFASSGVGRVSGSSAYGASGGAFGGQMPDIVTNVTLELDGAALMRKTYRQRLAEDDRRGPSLVNATA